MKIEFSNARYIRNYGKAPKGRGWWWFTFEGYEFEATGTLTEAKKACREYIKEHAPKDYKGTITVIVEP